MDVSLREVNRDNLEAVCRLQVAGDQQEFVETNAGSLAEAYVEPSFRPFAIYAGDEPVGFTMYGYEDPPGRWWVVRLMIDQRFQGRGYGRRAMELLLHRMVEREGCRQIVTSYVPGNEIAAHLYRRLGFVDTGEMDEGEHLLRLDVERAGGAAR
jgi:diamine N-acetyltransferase